MQFLGQHFLKNDSAIKKIIATLDIQPEETIIEIGPGKGALTFPLVEECIQKKCRLIAIEKDERLARDLELKIKSFPSHPCHSRENGNPEDKTGSRIKCGMTDKERDNIEIISGDALEILTDLTRDKRLTTNSYKIVGNIPYYITGKLLRTISELQNKPITSVLMVQKEVAERICSTAPKMNLLAAATQYWATPEIILNLKAKEFDPPPEVDSAVIKLTTKVVIPGLTRNPEKKTGFQIKFGMTEGDKDNKIEKNDIAQDAENYYKLIHIIFKQPRKTLANNLRAGLNISREEIEKILSLLKLPLNCRPQDISVDQILQMASRMSFRT